MTQYDAGPGDWSDRPWEDPDKKPRPQARRRVTLPPWALLAILVGIIILLCVGLVMIVQAIRRGPEEETPVPTSTVTALMAATDTAMPLDTTPTITPTATMELPISTPESTPSGTIIEPGVTVVVEGTQGAGLRVRAEPSTDGRLVTAARLMAKRAGGRPIGWCSRQNRHRRQPRPVTAATPGDSARKGCERAPNRQEVMSWTRDYDDRVPIAGSRACAGASASFLG
jgi:hypothetical protein